ncbi:MAG: ribbon-helix-helix protein, CopG family [Solirubrobacteraceae bacterium]
MRSHTATQTFTFRIPAELKRAIAELARTNERSPGAEIRYALRRHVESVANHETGTRHISPRAT